MNRRIALLALFVCLHGNAQKLPVPFPMDVFDVSNLIVLPNCEVDVELQVARWLIPESSWPATGQPRNYVAKAKIMLNGHPVEGANTLASMLADPIRVLAPPAKIKCGFIVVQGDASTSSRTVVTLIKNRIVSVEQIDFAGRTHSNTIFYYPKTIVLK